MVIEISGVVVFAVFCVASLATIADNLENQTATLEMPFWLFMGPLAVGSVLLVGRDGDDVRATPGAAGGPKRNRRC